MNKAHPFRLAIIVAAIILSVLSLRPSHSVDISVTGGKPTSVLSLIPSGGFESQSHRVEILNSGNVGSGNLLSARLVSEDGTVIKDSISLGSDYKAGDIIDGGAGHPAFQFSAGELAKGTTFHVSQLVEYMNLGLDLVGGSEIEYEVPLEGDVSINEIISILNRKLNNSGLKEIFIQPSGVDRVIIQLPGLKKSEVEQIKRIIETQGNLEFKIVENDEQLVAQAKELIKKGVELPTPNFPFTFVHRTRIDAAGIEHNIPGSERLVSANAKVTGQEVSKAGKSIDTQSLSGGYAVNISFNAIGKGNFGDLTEQAVGKQLAIVLDGRLVSHPNVNEPILGGECQITGGFSLEEADSLVTVLRSGSMDVSLNLLTENTVGPTLGADSITSGIKACLLGAIIVLSFMLAYYRGLGAIACIALAINMLMLMGAMALFGGTLTLPGIAGFALTIGMAVDATVLIFERMREETLKDQHIKASLEKAYGRAFVTIFDSNFTTFITALILFWAGNSAPVKGFCLSLMLGLSINLFAAVFVTQTLVSLLVHKGSMKSFNMSKALFQKSEINFFALGSKVRLISYALLIIGFGLLFTKGTGMLDVDFTGGNLLQVQLTEARSSDEMRKVVEGANYPTALVQAFGDGEGLNYTIRTEPLTEADKSAFHQNLLKNLPTSSDSSVAFPRDVTVGGVAATEMLAYAAIALIAAMLVILFYIMIRFSEFKYGLAACLALVHDVGITLGLLAIFDIQINLTIFAALLTVVGYSLNDTIVIFDRIRENIGAQKNYDFKSIAIRSLNQTLNRTLLTSVTTFFVIVSLIIVGGGVIEGFATTMLFGLITGTYSSLFIAAPFVLFLHKRDKNSDLEKENESLPKGFKPDPAGTV
jgi:SecD/SecF fusion protein